MFGPQCIVCDKGNTELSAQGWCDSCEEEFARVMKHIKCAESNGICSSRFSCRMQKVCVQLKAAIRLMRCEEC